MLVAKAVTPPLVLDTCLLAGVVGFAANQQVGVTASNTLKHT